MSKSERIIASAVGEGAGTLNSDFGDSQNREFTAYLDVTASTGTPTLDVKFQELDPASGKWFDIGAAGTFAQATGVTTERIVFTSNSAALRCVRTVGGTTPTFDYTVGLRSA